MKNRFMGNKAVIGLLAVLMAGASGLSVASDDRDDQSKKGKKAVNYDEMVLIPAGNLSSVMASVKKKSACLPL